MWKIFPISYETKITILGNPIEISNSVKIFWCFRIDILEFLLVSLHEIWRDRKRGGERERERRNRHTKHLIESHCEFMMVILIQFRVIKYVYLCEHHIWDSFAPNTFLASSNFNTCRYNFYILLHTKLCQLHLKYLNFIDMNNLSTNNLMLSYI